MQSLEVINLITLTDEDKENIRKKFKKACANKLLATSRLVDGMELTQADRIFYSSQIVMRCLELLKNVAENKRF